MEKHKGWVRYTKLREEGVPTIGEQVLKESKNAKYNTHSAQEQVDEELKNYPKEIVECINNGKKHHDGDFYIEVLFCYDRMLEGKRKNIFAARPTCPKPFYDQAAYKYIRGEDRLEFLWVVPDIDLCQLYRYNIGMVPDDEKELYENIRKYHNGDLAKIEYFENNKGKKKQFSVTRS